MNRAVIGVGSNIDPYNNINKARSILTNEQSLIKESPFVVTKPIGNTDQADFINGVFLIETTLSFDALQEYCKNIENRLGRVRTPDAYGPRTIDLDIVVWNGTIIDDDYYTREFLQTAVRNVLPGLTDHHYEKP